MRAIGTASPATLLVGTFYFLFTLVALWLHDWNPLWFMWVGERFANLDPAGRLGYDGQFAYYIARDGLGAVPHLDNPAYRLQRILLPLAIRLVSMEHVAAMPWTVLAINAAAITLTTRSLANWLHAYHTPRVYGAVYGLYVGVFMAYSRNLVEPLAFCLACLGIVHWSRGRCGTSVILLALATLTKEITLIMVIGLALAELVRAKQPSRMGMILAAGLPWLGWEGYLFLRFRQIPLLAGPPLQAIPLSGILPYLTTEPGRISALLFVALPAVALTTIALQRLLRHWKATPWWLVLLNGIFVVLMPLAVYDHIMHAGRNAVGLVMAATLAIPCMPVFARRLLAVCCVVPTLVWLVPVLRWAPWLSAI